MSLGKLCSLFGTQILTFVRWKDCVRWSLSSLPALIFFDLKTCMLVCLLSRFSCVRLFATLWFCNPSPPGSSVHGILQARILEWCCHALLQGIFLTQGLNPHLLHLLHCSRILYHWATEEAPRPVKVLEILLRRMLVRTLLHLNVTHTTVSPAQELYTVIPRYP